MTLIRFIKISASWSIGAKAPSAGWRSDHCLRWFDRDNWILPGNFYHWWPWSSWGWLQHEGFHWVCWARQLWRWFPQLLGQGRGPWGLARASLQRSWQMAGWQWWQSSVCFSRLGFAQICPRFFNMLFGRRVVSWLSLVNHRMESCQIKYLQDLARRSVLNTIGVQVRTWDMRIGKFIEVIV